MSGVSLASAWQVDMAPSHRVRAIAVSPDDAKLAVARDDRVVELRTVETGALLSCLAREKKPSVTWAATAVDHRTWNASRITCLAFSHSGDRLAVGFSGGAVHIWNCEDAECALGPVGASVSALAWSSDSSRLLVGRKSGAVDLTRADGSLVANLDVAPTGTDKKKCWQYAISSGAWHLRDPWVITVGGLIRVWRTEPFVSLHAGARLEGVYGSHMSGDGEVVGIYLKSGVDLQRIDGDRVTSVGTLDAMDQLWSSNRRFVLVGQGEPSDVAPFKLARIVLWDARTGEACERKIPGFVCATLSYCGSSVYVASATTVQKFLVQADSSK